VGSTIRDTWDGSGRVGINLGVELQVALTQKTPNSTKVSV
jgi:hypothetical protein